jgi:hypothetical protein
MFTAVLEDLKDRFGDKALLSPADIAPLIASSEKVQANLRSQGRFPIPVQKMGTKVGISIYHLAEYLANGTVNIRTEASKDFQKVLNVPAPKKSKSSPRSKEWLMAFRQHTEDQYAYEIELFDRLERMLDDDGE